MKVYVKFIHGGDVTVDNVESTDTKNNWFQCLDFDGDKLMAAPEHLVQYIEYIYE